MLKRLFALPERLLFPVEDWTAIRSDADRLIAAFEDQAYFEARDRVRGRCVHGPRSTRHWTNVKLEIARRQGIVVGLAGADRWGLAQAKYAGAGTSSLRP